MALSVLALVSFEEGRRELKRGEVDRRGFGEGGVVHCASGKKSAERDLNQGPFLKEKNCTFFGAGLEPGSFFKEKKSHFCN
jgi:hypothetical protein